MKNSLLAVSNSLSTMLRFRRELFERLSFDYDITLFSSIDAKINTDIFHVVDNHLKGQRSISIRNMFKFLNSLNIELRKRYKTVLLYGVDICFLSGLYFLIFGKRKKNVVFMFTGLGAIFLRPRYRIIRNILLHWIIDKVPDKIIVLNEDDREYILTLSRNKTLQKKIFVMDGEGVSDSICLRHGRVQNKVKRIVFASRPVIDKGCIQFQQIITALRKVKIDLPVSVYGFNENSKGELDTDYFRDLNSKGVRFEGHVNLLENHLQSSDLVFIISDREGANRVLLECLHLGLLFIASDVPGIKNFVPDTLADLLLVDFNCTRRALDKIKKITSFSPNEIQSVKSRYKERRMFSSMNSVEEFYRKKILC